MLNRWWRRLSYWLMHDPVKDQQQAPLPRPSCPKCGSVDIRRSHQEGALAALFRILGRWPFRCRSCRSRFYRSTPPGEDT